MTERANGVSVRDARPDDREAIRELTTAVYHAFAAAMEPDAWEGLRGAMMAALATEEPVQRIVAEREGEIVGSVMLYPGSANAYGELARAVSWPELRLLAVAPAARGMGIGRRLVEECVRRARASGARALGLHTSKTMEVARAMYEGMGFVRAPEHDFQPPGAELVTAYRLSL